MRTINTLVYHTQMPKDCRPLKLSCIHDRTMYSLCNLQGKRICYDPSTPIRLNVTLWTGLPVMGWRKDPEGDGRLYFVNYTLHLQQSKSPIVLTFDACKAVSKGWSTTCGSSAWVNQYKSDHKYLCEVDPTWKTGNPNTWLPCAGSSVCSGWKCVCDYTGGGYKGCQYVKTFQRGQGNTIIMEIERSIPSLITYAFGIDGQGKDPKTYLTIKVEKVIEGEIKSLGWSVYDSLRKLEKPLPISNKANNLFIEMAEEVAKALMVKNCFVCGGTNMGEQWPWEAMEAEPSVFNNLSRTGNITERKKLSGMIWTLSTNLVGRNCFLRTGSVNEGDLICLGFWDITYQKWSSPGNATKPLKFDTTYLSYLLSTASDTEWVAPNDMYWICGKLAYETLPRNWSGSCVLGWIKPSFFLLPIKARQLLGVPLYESMGQQNDRRRRGVDSLFSNFPCKELVEYEETDIWSSERIVCTYGKATWAEDGSWGYRTPIYMLNRIIRLQAVLDLAGQRLDSALNFLSETTDKIRTAVYQNRLALDYLLAREGGVCGKFNLSNCCLQIDETGKVIKQLTTELRQLTHNPDQVWNGFNVKEMFGTWFPKLPGLQAIVAFIGLIAAGCVLIPCILPLFIRTISNSLSLLADRKATAQILAMWEFAANQESEYATLQADADPSYVTLLADEEESQRGE
ncbi:endogenous retrovirus group 3 member 1 Env polyprotein-like [Erythrolamprus reginae]|uniref:endogenous retrovirus group 3 member 1 Env polyprotein-like n=1 Tax=Erythrolamprus reginae TaxID=121349 RepID=UPI00396C4B4A